MKNVQALFNELRSRKVSVSKRGAADVIKQTDARNIKRDFMNALVQDLKENLNDNEFIGIDANGIVLEIANEFVDAITFEINPKVKNLDFDAFESVSDFNREQEIKAQEKEQRKRDKEAEFKFKSEQRAKAKEKSE